MVYLIAPDGAAVAHYEPRPGVFIPAELNAAYLGGRPNDPPKKISAQEAVAMFPRES